MCRWRKCAEPAPRLRAEMGVPEGVVMNIYYLTKSDYYLNAI